MIPASYLFKTIYRDAWGIDLSTPEENPAASAHAGPDGFGRVAALLLRAGRAVANVGKLSGSIRRSRVCLDAACHG